jgi:phospho-2-dehydro-3-deoxyheptonate aldolase
VVPSRSIEAISQSISFALWLLGSPDGADRIIADHKYERQMDVARDVAGQISSGDTRIIGAMIESHINPGRQELAAGKSLAYGVSIADPCIGWDATSEVLYCRRR